MKSLSEEEFSQLVSELEMAESREVGGFQGLVDILRWVERKVGVEELFLQGGEEPGATGDGGSSYGSLAGYLILYLGISYRIYTEPM